MIEIECLVCGNVIKPRQLNDPDTYDTENYDGQIVCQECKSLLHVKLIKGKVQKSKIVKKNTMNVTPETLAALVETVKEIKRIE